MSSSQLNYIKLFIKFASRELKLKSLPNIKFAGSEENKKNAFGHSKGNDIAVRITERHPMDVMRTIAHELVHFKQNITYSNHNSQNREDEANMVAGRIMRKFNITYPHIFKEKAIREETVSAVPVNSMGASSSTHGTGGIDTYDPLMVSKILKRKKRKLKEAKEPPTPEEQRNELLQNRIKDMTKGNKGKGVNSQPNPLKQTFQNGNRSAVNTMNFSDKYSDNTVMQKMASNNVNIKNKSISSLSTRQ